MITANYVLVLPDENFSERNGLKIADSFEPAKHYSVRGKVVEVPNRLVYGGDFLKKNKIGRNLSLGPMTDIYQKLFLDSLEWDTDMELSVGDDVFFKYNMHMLCYDHNLIVRRNGRDHYLIRYDYLYMANESKMLNGWVLVEPVKWTDEELVTENGTRRITKKTNKLGVGIVKCVGSKNRDYLNYDKADADVSVGDKIFFRHSKSVPIEYKFHKTFEFGNCFRMQRKDILFIQNQ